MLNQVVIVGRLTDDIKLNKTKSNKAVSNITLAIPRSFKNSQGEYDTDFINCVLWENTAINTEKYCKKGDVCGIKGRLNSKKELGADGINRTVLEVVAEKITFLSSKSDNEEIK